MYHQNVEGVPNLPQPELPFGPKNNSFIGLPNDELLDNLKQVWENIAAWPKKPTGGWPGGTPDGVHPVAYFHDLTGYQLSAMNIALNKGGDTRSQKERLESLGLDPHADKNARHT